MMPTTEKNTLDKITSWASDKYGSAAPSLMGAAGAPAGTVQTMTAAAPAPAAAGSTGLLAAAAPAAAGTVHQNFMGWQNATAAAKPATKAATAAPTVQTLGSTSARTTAAPANVDVASWYRSVLGRDGDKAGIDYWQGAIDKGMDAKEAFDMFQKSASSNKEIVKKPSSWEAANTYTGPSSGDSGTIVDDWARNVLNRDLTVGEKNMWDARWKAATDPTSSAQVYKEFLEANKGGIVNQMDQASASQIASPMAPATTTFNPGVTTSSGLTMRAVDQPTETVQGQLRNVLAEDSQVLQQARNEGMRTAFDRGLGNSSIAASAGADALIRAATGIATTDSGYYNKAADYNVAAKNQLFMYDRDQMNQFKRLEMQLGSDEAHRQMQKEIAQMGDSTTRAGQSNQMTIAQMQDATARWNTEQAAGRDVSGQKMSLANNIIANMELSPDRKAAMLEELGMGTSAKYLPDGTYKAGTGLAGAVYVIDSVGDELGGRNSYRNPGKMPGESGG